MAIVKMNRFFLFAFEDRRENLLGELQKIEAVHFKNLQAEARELEMSKISAEAGLSHAEGELSKIDFALSKILPHCKKPGAIEALRQSPPEMGFEEFCEFTKNYDHAPAYDSIKANDDRQRQLKAEKNKLKSDIAAFSDWAGLDVSTLELDRLNSAKYILGFVPKQSSEAFAQAVLRDFCDVHLELLDGAKDKAGVLLVTLPEGYEELLAFAKSRGLEKVSLSFDHAPIALIEENKTKIGAIEAEETRLEEEIEAFAPHLEKLKIARDYFGAMAARHKACENFLKTQSVFAIEGWVSQDDSAMLGQTVEKACGNDYYLELAPVEKDSPEVPIKLKNNKFVSAFEGITEMYSMPKYNELDPTPLLAPFYFLFFAMMLGDAGYGIVLVAATLIGLKLFNLKKGAKRFFLLFFYLGIATTIMGVLYGSLFGVSFFAPVGGKPILDLTGDIMFMIALSIAIGFVQIMAGLCIKGYMLIRDGKILDALFDSLFWIIAVSSLVGLIALGVFGIDSIFSPICGWALAGSLLGLACTQGRASKGIGGKIGNGLNAVYGITGYVGDFVSYTRLMAIALSGAYIAFSFNLMGGLLVEDAGFLPVAVLKYIFAAVVVVFGAALNIGLGALSAYVHTCRLQYVEYFGKFYEGGGVAFKAFGTKNKYVNITNVTGRK